MTPDQILSAWERALLIFADECHNAHCVFSAAKATSDGLRLVLTYSEPKTKIDTYNVETATRRHLELTLNDGFRRGCEDLEIDASRVPPIVIRVGGREETPAPPEPVTPELPPHDAAPAAAAFTAKQRAAAAAFTITKLVGLLLARHAENNPEAILELAGRLDDMATVKKDPRTATGYIPAVERRIVRFLAKLEQ